MFSVNSILSGHSVYTVPFSVSSNIVQTPKKRNSGSLFGFRLLFANSNELKKEQESES